MQQRLDIQRIADIRRRDEILRIAERHGAHNVRIFGSVARGEARPDSDLDVLVDLDDGRTALDLSELIFDLQDALGCRVDVVEGQRRSRDLEPLERDAIAL
jgi:uncharacterized protein